MALKGARDTGDRLCEANATESLGDFMRERGDMAKREKVGGGRRLRKAGMTSLSSGPKEKRIKNNWWVEVSKRSMEEAQPKYAALGCKPGVCATVLELAMLKSPLVRESATSSLRGERRLGGNELLDE